MVGLRTNSGTSEISAATGDLTLKSEIGGGPTDNGGLLTIQAGAGGSTSGGGGSVWVIAGDGGGTAGTGGDLFLSSGYGTAGFGGGSVDIIAADGGDTGQGGSFILSAGYGGGTSGNGGGFQIAAGGAQTEGDGGNLTITAGDGAGAGSHGTISITASGAIGLGVSGGGVIDLSPADTVSLDTDGGVNLVVDGAGLSFTFSNHDTINWVSMTGPLVINTDAGTNGQVLTSSGALTPPSWEDASGGPPSYPLLAPDGVVTAPSYSFTNADDAGLWNDAGFITLQASTSAIGSVVISATDDTTNPGDTIISQAYVTSVAVTLSTADSLTGANASISTGYVGGQGVLSFDGEVGTPGDSAAEVGFKGVPQNIQNGDYALVIDDAGKHIIVFSSTEAADLEWTMTSADFPIGTAITIINLDDQAFWIHLTLDTGNFLNIADGSTFTNFYFPPPTDGGPSQGTILKVSATVWTLAGVNVPG